MEDKGGGVFVLPETIVGLKRAWGYGHEILDRNLEDVMFKEGRSADIFVLQIVNPKGEMKGSAITGPVGKEAAELWPVSQPRYYMNNFHTD